NSGPVDLIFKLASAQSSKDIGNISFADLNSSWTNDVLYFFDHDSPGNYTMTVIAECSAPILNGNPILSESVRIDSDENVGINLSYHYVEPFNWINATLILKNAENTTVNGTAIMSFVSLNGTRNVSSSVSLGPNSCVSLNENARQESNISAIRALFIFSGRSDNINPEEIRTFSLLPVCMKYNVTFATGYRDPGLWGILMNGISYYSSSQRIDLVVPNGTYNFRVLCNSSIEPFYANNFEVCGSNIDIGITFISVNYTVNISSPFSGPWEITLNGKYYSGSHSFSLQNGTYIFSIETPAGYQAMPPSLILIVNGSSINETVYFRKIFYSVVISAVNLTGRWILDMNGTAFPSKDGKVFLNLSAGSYSANPENTSLYVTDTHLEMNIFRDSNYTVFYKKRISNLTFIPLNYSLPFTIVLGNLSYTEDHVFSIDIAYGEYFIDVRISADFKANYPSTINVTRSEQQIYIRFSPVEYKIIFSSTVPFGLSVNNRNFSYGLNHSLYAMNGTYYYRAYARGYITEYGEINVNGKELRKNVNLSAFLYRIAVKSNAKRIIIRLNNQIFSSSNGTSYLDLENGSYSISLYSTGYISKTVNVNVSGSCFTLNVIMFRESYLMLFYQYIISHFYELIALIAVIVIAYYKFIRNVVIIDGKNEDVT
ncbi:MAG: hypothetical protein ACP5UV_01630, partial [Thermoplasmata archaeon]